MGDLSTAEFADAADRLYELLRAMRRLPLDDMREYAEKAMTLGPLNAAAWANGGREFVESRRATITSIRHLFMRLHEDFR